MRIRKGASFLVLLILLSCGGAALFRPLVTDCLGVVREGTGTRRYEAVSVDGAGTVALSAREDGRLYVVTGSLQGGREGAWSAPLPPAASAGGLAEFYLAGEDTAFLAVYEDEAQPWDVLAVYRVTRDAGAEALLRQPCAGGSSARRQADTRLSGFSRSGDEVRFALIAGGEVRSYACGLTGGGVERREGLEVSDALSAAVLPDGSLAVGGAGSLLLGEGGGTAVPEGQNVTYLTQAGAGLFYLDSAGLEVFYSDLTGSSAVRTAQLGDGVPLEGLSDLALTGQGGALLLMEGSRLVLCQGESWTDLSGMLYRGTGPCWAILIGLGGGVLLLTALIWYGLEGRRRGQLSLFVRWGGILLAAGAAAVLLLPGRARAAQEEESRRAMEGSLSGIVSFSLSQRDGSVSELTGVLEDSLDNDPSGRYRHVRAAAYVCAEDAWYPDAPSAVGRGELAPGFSARLARQAAQEGIASQTVGERFQLYVRAGSRVLWLSMDAGPLRTWPGRSQSGPALDMTAGAALVTALGLLALLTVARQLRKLTAGVEELSGGRHGVRVELRSGDELEGLACSLNSLAETMEAREREQEEQTAAFRRFVPERVLSLLGKQSILEVDKSTLATRRMAVMMVSFTFPMQVYDDRMQDFFDSVNQVIERTAGVVSRMGGTVFNFAYNGFDVVLDGDGALAVSTAVAVQQGVLSLNEARTAAGQPTVSLSIALDLGDVMVGVVGDDSQMEPTTISSSFTTVKQLIQLCGRLKAGILCTENVISGAKGYGSRYMGRSGRGDRSVRVYEIFDGDSYGLRRVKESSVQAFTQGVYALYSQDAPRAKRIFLELVHDGPADGGARYYLYLSDRLEKEGYDDISLDG